MSHLEIWDDRRGDEDLDPSDEVRRFRLLVIGRSGCGKTTILSKVCGDKVADQPSTTRGMHNIEREMEFKNNKLFVVHDSEGFEAGREDEFQVVVNFIRSRSRMKDINDRLHAIWYCLATNSRPIQQSEEIFFSVKHEVPVVAVFTKFDLLLQDQLQDLMEEDPDSEDLDEEELERQAEEITKEKFEKHYKNKLLEKLFPPQAVVAVSNIHTSTPMDSRLGELISATSKALNVEMDNADTESKLKTTRLRLLFARAQMGDLNDKYGYSVIEGTGVHGGYLLATTRARFPRVIDVWNTNWRDNPKPILSAFKTYVENHPETLGNKSSLKLSEVTSSEQEELRGFQLVTDLAVIMAEIFLLNVQDESVVKDIVQHYPKTPAFAFIRENVLKLREPSGKPHWGNMQDTMINAVKLNAEAASR